jgi:hypothetical protein
VPKAADFVEGIVKSVKEARKCMEAAQQKMKARADKHHREVVYSPGDMVMLSMKNMRHVGQALKICVHYSWVPLRWITWLEQEP